MKHDGRAQYLPVALAFVPLIITPGALYYFDTIPKLIVLLIGTGVMLPWWFPSLVHSGRVARCLFILLGAQAISLALSTALSPNPPLSIWGSNWRSLGFVTQAVLILFALVTFAWAAGNPRRVQMLLRAIAAAGVLAASYGILQYFGWDPWQPSKAYQAGEGIYRIVRPPGPMGHADYFADYLLFVVFAGAALVSQEIGNWRALGWGAASLAASAIVLSGTRGAVVGLAVGAAYLVIRLRPRISTRAMVAAAAVGGAAFLFYLSPAGTRLRSRVHWIGEDVHGGARLYLWRDSLRFAVQHPLAGAGLETFPALFPQFQSPELARAYPDFYYESPHNFFLDALAQQGVIGLGVLAALLWFSFWAASGKEKPLPQLGAGIAAAAGAHCFSVLILPTAMYFYVFIALQAALRSAAVPRLHRGWILAPVSAAMILLALRLLAADRSLELARRDIAAGRTTDAIAHYRAAREGGLSADLWYARSLAAAAPVEAMEAASRATASEDAQNAHYTMAWLYARAGDLPQTEQSLRATLACAPNWYKPHWMLAQVLQRQGRVEEARAEAQRASYLNDGRNPEAKAAAPASR